MRGVCVLDLSLQGNNNGDAPRGCCGGRLCYAD